MSQDLQQVVARFAGLRVLVIGDIILDSYLRGTAARLCQEAPVPVAVNCTREDFPGGAANSAANIASLGGFPVLVAALGRDFEGDSQHSRTRHGLGQGSSRLHR